MKGIGYAIAALLFSLLMVTHSEAQTQNDANIEYISPVPGSFMNMPQATIVIRTKEKIDPASLSSGGIISVMAAASGNMRVNWSFPMIRGHPFVPTCHSQKGRRLP